MSRAIEPIVLSRHRRLSVAATLAVAVTGGGLATLAGLPASWLSGAMIAVTAASLAGLDTRLPLTAVEIAFLLIGTALGSGVTPELIRGAAAWPLSLIGLGVSVLACTLAVRAFLIKVAGWDRDSAFFAAVPGALSYVLAVAAEAGADVRKVAASQSIRLFLLVAVLPSLLVSIEGGPPAPPPVHVAGWWDIAGMLAFAAAVGLAFRRLKVPAGRLTGAFAASALLHGTGLVAGTLPMPVVIVAFLLLGTLIGSRFVGTGLRFIGGILAASIGGFFVATGIAGMIAVAGASTLGVPIDQAIVAFSPGGLDAMMSVALALHMDSAYVAAHQFARFAGIAFTLPIVLKASAARRRAAEGRGG